MNSANPVPQSGNTFSVVAFCAALAIVAFLMYDDYNKNHALQPIQSSEKLRTLKSAKSGDLVICTMPSNPVARAVLVQKNLGDSFEGTEINRGFIEHRVGQELPYEIFADCNVMIIKGNPVPYDVVGKIIITGQL